MKPQFVRAVLAALILTQAASATELTEDREIFLAVEFNDGLGVQDSLVAYETSRGVLVPARELLDAIGISVAVDPRAQRISGFVLREANTFSLSLSPCRLVTAKGDVPFDCKGSESRDDDIFLTLDQVSRIIPARISLDRFASKLVLEPDEPFPPQQRARRGREMISGGDSASSQVGALFQGERVWGRVTGLSYNLAGQSVSGEAPRGTAETSVVGGFLGFDSRLRHSVGSDAVASVQWSLSEFTDSSSFELVDFVAPNVPLLGSPGVLRGFHFANQAEDSTFDPLDWTIDGSAPDGWDVELTQNGQLLQRTSVTGGRYQFQRVRLQAGLNRFSIVLLGPQGQRRVEGRSVDVEANLASSQPVQYRIYSGHNNDGQWTHLATGLVKGGRNWGVRLTGGQFSLPKEPTDRAFAGAGVVWFGDGLSSSVQLIGQNNGRWLSELSARLPFSRGLLSVVRVDSDGFGSYQFRTDQGQTLKSRNSLTGYLQGTLGVGFFSDLELNQTNYVEGAADVDLRWKIATQLQRMNLLYDLRATKTTETTYQGQLTASLPAFWGDGRLSLSHDSTTQGVRQVQAQFNIRAGRIDGVQGHLTYTTESRAIDATIDYRWEAWKHQWAAGGGWSSLRSEPIVRLSVSSSLDFSQPSRERPQFTTFDRADYVTSRVQVQSAADGRPFEGAEILLNGQRTGERTGADGVAVLRNLPRRQTSRISVRTDDLEDPFLRPDPPAQRIKGAPGRKSDLSFSMQSLGEISGFIRSARQGVRMGGIRVSLFPLAAEGGEALSVRTSSDGYFYFGEVKPGRYRIAISAEDLSARRLEEQDPKVIEVTIDPSGDMSHETTLSVK